MQSQKRFFVVLIALVILGAGAVYADFHAGLYTTQGPETIHSILTSAGSTDAVYDAGQYPLYSPELAAGNGKDDVENNCQLCHSPRYITMQPPMPAQAWAAEVDKMRKTFGAPIPDDAAQRIVQYLSTHYTPETRKQ
jgi:hypothetical protein